MCACMAAGSFLNDLGRALRERAGRHLILARFERIDSYLSVAHRGALTRTCPLAALGSEAAQTAPRHWRPEEGELKAALVSRLAALPCLTGAGSEQAQPPWPPTPTTRVSPSAR